MRFITKIMLSLCFVPTVLQASTEVPECSKSKPAVMVTNKSPEFTVRFKSNPSTGYSWFIRDNFRGLKPISAEFKTSKKKHGLVGQPGEEVWRFKVKSFKVPRQFIMHFVYARPFEIGVSTGFVCQVSAIKQTTK